MLVSSSSSSTLEEPGHTCIPAYLHTQRWIRGILLPASRVHSFGRGSRDQGGGFFWFAIGIFSVSCLRCHRLIQCLPYFPGRDVVSYSRLTATSPTSRNMSFITKSIFLGASLLAMTNAYEGDVSRSPFHTDERASWCCRVGRVEKVRHLHPPYKMSPAAFFAAVVPPGDALIFLCACLFYYSRAPSTVRAATAPRVRA